MDSRRRVETEPKDKCKEGLNKKKENYIFCDV
jgi:hypothetical protein